MTEELRRALSESEAKPRTDADFAELRLTTALGLSSEDHREARLQDFRATDKEMRSAAGLAGSLRAE